MIKFKMQNEINYINKLNFLEVDCDNARFCGDIFSVAKTYAGTLGTVGTAKN